MAYVRPIFLMCAILLHTGSSSGQTDGAGIFSLTIPGMDLRVTGNATAQLPHGNITHLQIQIALPPSQVGYGNIYARINTESANVVMTTSATATGVNCDFDLIRRQGFRLKVGRNSVEIALQDPRGRIRYASFLLEQSAQATDKRETLPILSAAGERYALIIGIARYRASAAGIRNLAYADRDAVAIRDFLASAEGGYRRENIVLLLDEEATLEHVRSALMDIASRATEDDMVAVYVSGHGVTDPEDRRKQYLLAHDSRPDALGETGLPLSELEDFFGRSLKAKTAVTFVDVARPNALARGAAGANTLVHQYLSRYASSDTRGVLAAADVGESSVDADATATEGRSVFARYVVQGLRGEADTNRDGTVTFGELKGYVRDNVRKATGGQQSPIGTMGNSDAVALAGLRARSSK